MNLLETITDMVPRSIFSLGSGTLVEQVQHLVDQSHPGATNMILQTLSHDQSEADIPYAKKNRALHGYMHGGCFYSVGDTLTAVMAIYHVENTRQTALTMGGSIRYLRPINRETVKAVAKLRSKKDSRLDFVVDFFNSRGKRAAQAKYTVVIVDEAAN